ncbi:MAG: restriction endonuclease [Cenarchaeum sp. SB0665_bin_23]|nr:restriction endonuclease [Cenarchaeum sp. SB0665_bin_23]MYG32951.1 restriction endonuclease [Cenarchaeum sp. SB0677_bin_16]
MPITCECGEVIQGDTCMLCGWSREDTPATDNNTNDDQQSGTLGDNRLDITSSIHIMDMEGNTIFDVPYEGAECSVDLLGALCIRHNGTKTRLKGTDAKAWRQAISYRMNAPIWYLHGDEDCQILYGDITLGVTPCIITPPFSWDAFRTGHYTITVSRPGSQPKAMNIKCRTGSHTIRYKDGEPAQRVGATPEGEVLVLNNNRRLVMSDMPYLTDRNGVVVLPMPGAQAEIKFLKRGATISWKQEGIGVIHIPIQCDNKLKYDKLALLLPKPVQEKKIQGSKKSRFNQGSYQGINLEVTSQDVDTRLGRFADGYSFEAVCANILSAMGYNIEKGYDVRTKRILGSTTSDMGVDILAVKGDERVIVQCKHWKSQCGGPDVNKTLGSATTHNGNKVLMICTGGFTTQAADVAKQSTIPVLLWDWDTLRSRIKKHLL